MRTLRVAVLLVVASFGYGRDGTATSRKKSNRRPTTVVSCPEYGQERVGDEGLRLELRNTCGYPVRCTLSWEVHCRGRAMVESPGARSSVLALANGASDAVIASGVACGSAGWEIDNVRWTCDRDDAKVRGDPAY